MVFITIFMDTLAATISTPALPYYARSFHVNNAAVGYLYAARSRWAVGEFAFMVYTFQVTLPSCKSAQCTCIPWFMADIKLLRDLRAPRLHDDVAIRCIT